MATEFLRLIDEGWQPDLDEFLARVPDDQREECKKRIEELCSLNGVDLGSVAAGPQDDLEALAGEIHAPEELEADEGVEEEEAPAPEAALEEEAPAAKPLVRSNSMELAAGMEEPAPPPPVEPVEDPYEADPFEEAAPPAADPYEAEAALEPDPFEEAPAPAAAPPPPEEDDSYEEEAAPEPTGPKDRKPLEIRPIRRASKPVQQQLMSHVREVENWRRGNMIPRAECDRLTIVYRRLMEELASEEPSLTHGTVFALGGAALAVTGALLMVWLAHDSLPAIARWFVPAAVALALVGAGLWARLRRDGVAAAALLAAGALAIGPALLALLAETGLGASQQSHQLLPDSPLTNLRLLIASTGALAVSLVAFGLVKQTVFAWTTALLTAVTYCAVLLTQNALDLEPQEAALRLLPLLALAIPGLACEAMGKVRWAQPFNLVALVTLVVGLDVLAGGLLAPLAGVLGEARLEYLGFTAVGIVLMAFLVVMERTQSLGLRRGARLLEPLAVLHLVASLHLNAAKNGNWADVTMFVGMALILLVVAPWRGRVWYLAGGLASLALAATTVLQQGLVDPTVFTLSVALTGLAIAVGSFTLKRRAARGRV
ncbi:MAG: hypothetical protein ACYTG3_04455 [Planctomycetota bacterium]